MNGRLLFLCSDHFDLYRIFQRGFERYSGCEVTTVLWRSYEYRNPAERLIGHVAKRWLKRNLRRIQASRNALAAVPPDSPFDYVVVICPELWYPAHLESVLQRAGRSIVYYWDGFDHFPAYRETLDWFDERITFDPVDAQRYGLKFVPNFYWHETRDDCPDQDLFFIGGADARLPRIMAIIARLESQGRKMMVRILCDDPALAAANTSRSITFIDRFLPAEEVAALAGKSRVLLDVHKEIQHGLSLRVFDAMGAGKKLITTNADIVNYDFYRPENIYVWDGDGASLPVDFFSTPYRELDEAIYHNYSQETWVKTVLGISGGADSYRC
jgi:hypothetical protein